MQRSDDCRHPDPLRDLARQRRHPELSHALHAKLHVHIELIARRFDFTSHGDLFARLQRPARRPFCLLTFDDGKKSHFTQVAPALRRLGVPAVFYVPTEFLAHEHRALWFDRVGAIRGQINDLPAELREDALKRLPSRFRDERIDEACQRYGIDADMTDDNVAPMSWDDARALHAAGFTIGAHSRWHAILPLEPLEEATDDIAESLARVSREIGAPCTTFAFPNGNYTRRLALHAQRCGAASVFTTEPMWVRSRPEWWRLPRIQLFTSRSLGHTALKLAVARVPGLLNNPDGTGRLYSSRGDRPEAE